MQLAVMAIDSAGKILAPVSQYTEIILGSKVENKDILSTLFKDIPSKSELGTQIRTFMATVFGEGEIQWELLEGDLPKIVEFRRRASSGEMEKCFFSIKYAPVWSANDALEKIIFIVEDITKLKKIEEELRKNKARSTRIAIILEEVLEQDISTVAGVIKRAFESLSLLGRMTYLDFNEKEAIDRLKRELHTIKGNARMAGLKGLSFAAHTAEQHAEKGLCSQHRIGLKSAFVVLIQELIDYEIIMRKYLNGENCATFWLNSIVDSFSVNIKDRPLSLCWVDCLNDIFNITDSEIVSDEYVERVINDAMVKTSMAQRQKNRQTTNNNIVVNLVGYERLKNAICSNYQELLPTFESLTYLPIKQFFAPLSDMVFDIAKTLEKKVNFEIESQDVYLPKEILDPLMNCIVQLLRNSLDHGLESTNERESLGKQETGVLRLKASIESDLLIIVVEDDGRGINTEILHIKAVELGLVSCAKEAIYERDKFDLIFLPGLSSKNSITNISGRGVGMDVVKNNILKLGGELKVSSQLNKGTSFNIKIPLMHQHKSY